MPPRVFNVQVVQGASEPGGHQAAGGHGRLCSRVPGAFSQPAGEHADQDQSCWWVNVIYTNIYNWLNVPDFVDRDRMFFLECISPLFFKLWNCFFLQLKVKSLILAASCWSDVWMLVTGIYRELCLESVKNKYECEIQAACQHWEVRGQHMSQSSAFLYVKPHFVHIYFCLYSVGETQCHSVHYLNRLNWPTVTSPGDVFNVFFSVFFFLFVSPRVRSCCCLTLCRVNWRRRSDDWRKTDTVLTSPQVPTGAATSNCLKCLFWLSIK